jgi:hypothetical protein
MDEPKRHWHHDVRARLSTLAYWGWQITISKAGRDVVVNACRQGTCRGTLHHNLEAAVGNVWHAVAHDPGWGPLPQAMRPEDV